jgi:geranylgeranyl diphosphate synthase type II
LELAQGEDLAALNHWLSLKEFDKVEKVNAVKAIYEKLGIRSLTEAKMQSYFEAGFSQFEGLHFQNEEYYQALYAITQDLIHREK